MADLVLTKDSWLACAHQASPGPGVGNNGISSALRVSGQQALLDGDLTSAAVTACPLTNSGNDKKCLTVAAQTAGAAQKLRVRGRAVLTDKTAGGTDGAPNGTFSVADPRQTKLKAV